MYHLKIWSSGIKSLAISTLSNLRETSSSPSLHSDRFLNCARSSISLHVPVWCKFISHVFNLNPPPKKECFWWRLATNLTAKCATTVDVSYFVKKQLPISSRFTLFSLKTVTWKKNYSTGFYFSFADSEW